MTVLDAAALARCTDDDLMRRLEAGEAETALAELQARHRERIERLIRTMVRDRGLADELTYEVFAKIFLKSHLYRPGTNFHAWLSEVARNHTLTALRRRTNETRGIGSFADEDQTPVIDGVADPRTDRSLEEAELMAALDHAITKLPPTYRDVFTMCVQGDAPYKEAARKFGIPTGTVAIRIMRARQRLFREVAPHLGRVRRLPACLQVHR